MYKLLRARARLSEKGEVAEGVFFTIIIGLVICALIFVIWLIMFMGGWKSVPPDKVLLHYTGGPVQGIHFKEVVPPGTHTKFYGLMDNYFYLPATQRNYIISKDPSEGDENKKDYISAPSNDNVQFTFEAAVYFKLNSDPQTLRTFMEQICLHDHCTNLSPGKGWDKMLKQYFRPQIDNAVRLQVNKYDREQLYRDPDTLLTIQKTIGDALKERVNAALGGEFFCGPDSTPNKCTDFGFVLKDPTPPQSVVDAYADSAASEQQVVTAQNNAKANVATATGSAQAQRIQASAPPVPESAIGLIQAKALQDCARNPNCKITFITGNTPVIANGG